MLCIFTFFIIVLFLGLGKSSFVHSSSTTWHSNASLDFFNADFIYIVFYVFKENGFMIAPIQNIPRSVCVVLNFIIICNLIMSKKQQTVCM